MNDPQTLPAINIELSTPPQTKWESEFRAFQRLLPQLLVTHYGRYIAIHEGKVVDCGDDKLDVALRVLGRVGNVAIHVGRVSNEPDPIARSGVRRELRPFGGDCNFLMAFSSRYATIPAIDHL